MSNPIPSSLALTAIANGQLGDATPVANNYSQIQAAVNALITALSGGTAGQLLQAVDGSDVAWFTKLAPSRQILTASGTYTLPTNCKTILVECVGGGGAGGGTASAAGQLSGGGASGGAYAAKLIVSPSTTYTYTIGAAGAVGATGPNNGGNGGNTIFGANLVVGAAGIGGIAQGAAGTAPGQDAASPGSSTGDIIVPGNDSFTPPGSGGTGGGGGGPYGGGNRRGPIASSGGSSNGQVGWQYGGGGSGGFSWNSGGTTTGGAGFQGVIIVTEYY